MVLEERMIKCRLFVDVYTIYDISIWALFISQNQWSQLVGRKTEKIASKIPNVWTCEM
jgi:hypothetical protein